MKRKILVGDIGGTKTELALVSEGILFDRIEKFASKEYSSLEEILIKFLGKEKVDLACFGVAGPVNKGECHTTNLPWIIESKNISKRFNISEVFLLNDLVSASYGICKLSQNQFYQINRGTISEKGNLAVISPGTGLGEALMIYDEKQYIPVSSEGGHVDFAPRNEKEIELYRYLKKKYSHVSYERILSGQGISDLYAFLNGGIKKDPEIITKENPEVLKWFCEILGAEAGNLVLKGYAMEGIYIGGGIVLQILDILKEGDFMFGFLDKGRFTSLLKNIPVHIILDPHVALFGAIFFCERLKK